MLSHMKNELELRQMRYFLAVAETLHFGRAASQLRIAQPNLSQQIKKIEQALGHALLTRTTRGVALTPAGQFLAGRAATLRGSFEDAIRTARRIGEGAEGTLSIGFSGSAMYGRLPFVVDHFRRLYPKVQVQLREMYAHEQQPLLLDGTLDVGFIRDGARLPGLKMSSLSKEPFVAVLPQSHRLAMKHAAMLPSALQDEAFVLFPHALHGWHSSAHWLSARLMASLPILRWKLRSGLRSSAW